jgi:hypothetical protein
MSTKLPLVHFSKPSTGTIIHMLLKPDAQPRATKGEERDGTDCKQEEVHGSC